ncbi:MAG: aromatic-ring-hydroxylating dioxygenase subunit beta [Acidimicrobiaceae bacterium]|nr:aromatic-ring-hydroxylating dioxygenase subunit beta [Acidimicrobiaceae bacterium]
MATLDEPTRRDIEAFVYLEARLADESRYDEWEALVTDDMHYWVPFGPGDYEPGTRVSYINDNRARLATRIRQLATGVHHAQDPPSSMRRVVSNIEILSAEGDEFEVGSNFVLYEHAVQATGHLRLWAGRTTYRLRPTPDGLRMAAKKVELVNSTSPLPNLPFII